jgi:hypothetical protein
MDGQHMRTSEAISIIKGYTPDCSRAEILEAWQHLVDVGTIWNMGEHWSKLAACMIEAGTLKRNEA